MTDRRKRSGKEKSKVFGFETDQKVHVLIEMSGVDKNTLKMSIRRSAEKLLRSGVSTASLGTFRVDASPKPPALSVSFKGRTLFSVVTNPPPGKRGYPTRLSVSDGSMTIPFEISEDEGIYGLGEFFGDINRNGHELTVNVKDAFTLPNDETYVTYPFFWSTRGYGIFVNTTSAVRFDFGRNFKGTGDIDIEEGEADIYIFQGRPEEIIDAYWRLTGRPSIPPLWSYGLWMSRCSYRNEKELLSIAGKIRRKGLPCDVLHLDPDWLRRPIPYSITEMLKGKGVDPSSYGDNYGIPGVVLDRVSRDYPEEMKNMGFPGEGCTFEWNTELFPDPEGMIRKLHDMSFRLSLWINPYVPRGSKAFEYLLERGLFVSDSSGVPIAEFDRVTHDFGTVDFTNPDARQWYADNIRKLCDQGVDIFKTDYGEGAPRAGGYYGLEGRKAHNALPTLYNETVFNAVKEKKGEGIVWGRSGGLGIHRFPLQWGGDPSCTSRDMYASLRGALSYSLSGGAFMSFDIGGFAGEPDPELYARWSQMGLLFSHSRAHGTTPREPWNFGRRAEAIFTEYDILRYSLIPYLYWQSVKSVSEGKPLVRALVFEFPEDAFVRSIQDEYMLGETLLIAPLARGEERTIYLPDGVWQDFWTGRKLQGPSLVEYTAPLEVIPVFVRRNCIIVRSDSKAENADEKLFSKMTVSIYGSSRLRELNFGRYGSIILRSKRGKLEASGKGLLSESKISVRVIR